MAASSFYDWVAPIYDELYEQIDVEEAVRQWGQLVRQESGLPRRDNRRLPRLLDIGCGTGRYLEPWAAAGFCVTGIDASRRMLTKARRRRKASRWARRMHLICGDVRRQNAALRRHGPFDIAVAHFNFLNLFPPQGVAKILTALTSSMKRGARLFTDCAPPQLMPKASRERLQLGVSGIVNVETRPDLVTGVVDRAYRGLDSSFVERYWLHSERALTDAAKHSGWAVENTFLWRPERSRGPWTKAGREKRHRVYVFCLIADR